ncbi:mapk-regulated corepressor-interacting protein 1 isoform X2 [Gopherus flavomarginatus]|uniref:mapk-regulated corepressor-interacting protein 1 isoform X2 n=1 Tax=Gopherus flavomarginatus TaxID=286002 RepID=UPI0021CBDA70|nr:mapk-regulated corepressor-interacting protein 1 isoform X2 [Gopherus flavomarginatus]
MTSSPVSRVVYNGKRNSSPRSPSNSSEIFTPAHEENVRFIYEGDVREIAIPELFFLGGRSEELSQIDVSLEEVLEKIDKLNSNKSPRPDGITQEF